MNDDAPSPFISVREFERHTKHQDERHSGLVMLVEDLKTKHAEQRDQLRDIRALLSKTGA